MVFRSCYILLGEPVSAINNQNLSHLSVADEGKNKKK